ncbi:MAG: DUF547 domain-containing protein [Verrucomicrobia bacterium]|nr:DUF547 domain-containing protein [Verrucomicrobiota bacterium]
MALTHRIKLFPVLALLTLGAIAPAATAFDHGHASYDQLLKQRVSDGWVDYAALKADSRPLRNYLNQLASVSEAEFRAWNEKERLAFLFNLYNAATLQLILDHYPVKSIKDIGGFFSGPWKQKVVRAFGRVFTLEHLEHEIIRKELNEPRAHFSLVCAAKGCPPLRSEAYVAKRLDEQLDDQGRIFMRQRDKNRVDAGSRTLYLSPIFKWFSGDFEAKSGSVLNFVKPYFSKAEQLALNGGEFSIRYTDYDWTLNSRSVTN